jgi:hypothetical protein
VGDQHDSLVLAGRVQACAHRVDHPGRKRRPFLSDVQQGRHGRVPAKFGQAAGDWFPGPRPNRGAVDQDKLVAMAGTLAE